MRMQDLEKLLVLNKASKCKQAIYCRLGLLSAPPLKHTLVIKRVCKRTAYALINTAAAHIARCTLFVFNYPNYPEL